MAGVSMVTFHDNTFGTDISTLFPQSGTTGNTINIYADVNGNI
jgi:hypothetical protein